MRKWAIVGGVVVLLLTGGIVLAVLNLNRFLDENRDLIAEQARAAIGREVRFGDVGVYFGVGVGGGGGLGVRVEDLRVGDDPSFSAENFVAADAIDVQVEILPALFGRIEVSRAVLVSPTIRVIQTAAGLSTDSLGGASSPEQAAAPEAGGSSVALGIALVDVRNGSLHFRDETATPPLELGITQLDSTASEVGFDHPIAFELDAAVLGATSQNLHLSGTVGPLRADTPALRVELRLGPLLAEDLLAIGAVASAAGAELSASGPLTVSVDAEGTLAQLDFVVKLDAEAAAIAYAESFDKSAGIALALELVGRQSGDDVTLETLAFTLGDTELRGRASAKTGDVPAIDFRLESRAIQLADVGASDPSVTPPEVLRGVELEGALTLPEAGPTGKLTLRSADGIVSAAPYRNLVLDLGLAGTRTNIETLSLEAFGGELSATGYYDTKDPERPRFALSTRLADMRVEQIVESQAPGSGEPITGALAAKLDLRGAGTEWDPIAASLAGSGSVRIAEGVLKEFNPAGDSLRVLMTTPGIAGPGLRSFFDAHPQIFGSEDAPFEMMDGKLRIAAGQLNAKDFEMIATDYQLAGEGVYGLVGEGTVDFQAALLLSAALSEQLVAAEKSFRYLRRKDGRVALPLAIRGTPSDLSVLPDANALARVAGQEAVIDLLGRVLGGSSAGEAGGSAAEGGAAESESSGSGESTADLLRRGLGGLFGGGRKGE